MLFKKKWDYYAKMEGFTYLGSPDLMHNWLKKFEGNQMLYFSWNNKIIILIFEINISDPTRQARPVNLKLIKKIKNKLIN